MADWLLIRIGNDPDHVDYLTADAAGRIVAPLRTGPLTLAAMQAVGHRICVLAPASDVLLTDAEVPPRSGARVQQIVPYALEEQLAEDIDSLQFAVGRRVGDSPRIPVAVVSRALLDNWLGQLREVGLEPDAVYADSSLVPENPGQAVLVLSGDNVILRASGLLPVTLPLSALGEALELLRPAQAPGSQGAIADDVPTLPALPATAFGGNGLVVYAGESEWQQYGALIEAERGHFEGLSVQLLADGPLGLFAQSLPGTSAINLLQGSYAPASPLAGSFKAWRIAAAMLVGLLVLHGIGSAAQLLLLKRAEKRLDQSISETFEQAMPGEHNSSNARRRMEARLIAVQGSTDSAGLLAMLSAVAQARNGATGTTLQALSYRDGLLELQVSAPGADALDHISQQLRTGGWRADLTSTTSSGGSYQGRIQMKPGT
ncbi:MAG TPA: type II secretion system protein GspL [Steroidobacteraceae bacterium]|nr:type II secretion system protein GspL [Steroidobacteraceae bacterium]